MADALIKAGKNAEAVAVLKKDLMINPKNGWALTGETMAYQNMGDAAGLKKAQQQLKAAWAIKDVAVARPVF